MESRRGNYISILLPDRWLALFLFFSAIHSVGSPTVALIWKSDWKKEEGRKKERGSSFIKLVLSVVWWSLVVRSILRSIFSEKEEISFFFFFFLLSFYINKGGKCCL